MRRSKFHIELFEQKYPGFFSKLAQSILLQHPPKTQFFGGGGGQQNYLALCTDSVPPTLTAGFRPWMPLV